MPPPSPPKRSKSKGEAGEETEQVFLGDAHAIFESWAKWKKVEKKGANDTTSKKERVLTKEMLQALMKSMHEQKRIRFTDPKKMQEWVAEQHDLYDTDKNGYISLEEFVRMYHDFLSSDPEAVLKRYNETASELERIFVASDTDGSFSLARDELISLMQTQNPKGYPPPSDERLSELADELIKQFDADQTGAFEFDEFCEAYNVLLDKLKDLHEEIRTAVLSKANLHGMVQTGTFIESEEAELAELEELTKDRFNRNPWVCRKDELTGEREGGNVLERARRAGKLPILLKHPDQEFDDISQHLASKGAMIHDMQGEIMAIGKKEKTEQAVVDDLTAAICEAMDLGKMLVIRLANSAPDLMFDWHYNYGLPNTFWTAENMTPGCTLTDDHLKLLKKHKYDTSRFAMFEGFHLVFASCFSTDDWKQFLRCKLPLGEMQPVQVCHSIQQVADVIRFGLLANETDTALSEMDRLADML